jgi:hypothetical protein
MKTRCNKLQTHDAGQFLYSLFLIVLWSINPPDLPTILSTHHQQTSNTRCGKLQTHDLAQFLYSVFLIVLWSAPSPQTCPPIPSPRANYKFISEVLFILACFKLPSGLHSDTAVKILNVWQSHDHMTATWQILSKNNLYLVNNDK